MWTDASGYFIRASVLCAFGGHERTIEEREKFPAGTLESCQRQNAGFESRSCDRAPTAVGLQIRLDEPQLLSIPHEISVLEPLSLLRCDTLWFQCVFFDTRAIKSSSLERNSFRIGDVFILL